MNILSLRPIRPALVMLALLGCADAPARCPEGAPCGDASSPLSDGGPVDAAIGDTSERDALFTEDAFTSADAFVPSDPDAGDDRTPPPEVPPAEIGHLSLSIRTGAGASDGSNGAAFEICVNATDCFPLDVADVDDFRRGEIDVFHFERLHLSRADARRVELRWRSGSDGWRPVCMEMQFDGEPVYCQAGLDATLGNGAGEVRSWRDPEGLHTSCTTCFPERVTHGPMVGSVGPNEARIWVRTDATRPVTLQLIDDAGARIDVGPRYPRPGNDFTTVFRATGLRPRTDYTAHVAIRGERIGRPAHFRTAPREGAAGNYRFGFGSCANDDNFPVQPVFDRMTDRNMAMFFFIGDTHYGNTGVTQAHWWRYRRTMEMPARARFYANTPTVATWDDHDFTGNNSSRLADGRERALRGFSDYWANPAFGTDRVPGTFFVQSYGDVDFFVLDDRYYRDRPATDANPDASILGEMQAQWLEDALLASRATFRFIASGSSFTRAGESWLDYPASRRRLFRFIERERIGGVVLLGGDIHRTQIRWIERPGAYDLPELVSSGMATHEDGTCPARYPVMVGDAREVWCSQEMPTFMTLDVDTTRGDPQLVVRHIDGASGAVRHTVTINRSQLRF